MRAQKVPKKESRSRTSDQVKARLKEQVKQNQVKAKLKTLKEEQFRSKLEESQHQRDGEQVRGELRALAQHSQDMDEVSEYIPSEDDDVMNVEAKESALVAKEKKRRRSKVPVSVKSNIFKKCHFLQDV